MKIINYQIKHLEQGFTIVELMIALSVLSVILLMSTIVMINIGGLYDKGVTSANLQNASRNIVADITSGIQFSASPPEACLPPTMTYLSRGINNYCSQDTSSKYPYQFKLNNSGPPVYIGAYCVGVARYSFIINAELGLDSSTGINIPYVLWRDTLSNPNGNCTPASNMVSAENNPSQNPTTNDNNSVSNSGYEMLPEYSRLTEFDLSLDQNIDNSNVYNVSIATAYGESGLLNIPTNNGQVNSEASCKSTLSHISTNFCATYYFSTTVAERLY